MNVKGPNFLFRAFFVLYFLAIAAACQDRVLVGGSNGEFAISDDGGKTWIQHFVLSGYKITCIIETGNGNLIVGTSTGSFISKNRGRIWSKFLNSYTDSAFIVGNNAYLVYSGNYITNSTDHGETWCTGVRLTFSGAYRAAYKMGQRFYFGSSYAGLVFTDDYFNKYTVIDRSSGMGGNDVWAIAGEGRAVYAGINADGAPLTISYDGFVSMGTVFIDPTRKNNGIQSLATACGTTYASLRSVGVAVTQDVFSPWSIKTPANGLASNNTLVVATGSCNCVYAATSLGLSISRDGGHTWITKTTADGLPTNSITAVFVKLAGRPGPG